MLFLFNKIVKLLSLVPTSIFIICWCPCLIETIFPLTWLVLMLCHHQQCQFRPQYLNSNNNRLPTINGWTRGSYQCLCKQGFYSTQHPDGFNGTIMEVAFVDYLTNVSSFYVDAFICLPCMEGCESCIDATPCQATYQWPFRYVPSLITHCKGNLTILIS